MRSRARKTESLNIRLTREEKTLVSAAAAKEGAFLSEYVRHAVTTTARRDLTSVPGDGRDGAGR